MIITGSVHVESSDLIVWLHFRTNIAMYNKQKIKKINLYGSLLLRVKFLIKIFLKAVLCFKFINFIKHTEKMIWIETVKRLNFNVQIKPI